MFPTKYPSPLAERNQTITSVFIESFDLCKATSTFFIWLSFNLVYTAWMCITGRILHWDFIYLAFFVFTDPHIEREQAQPAANRLQMACEAFGDGMLPQLQSAVYKVPWDMLALKILLVEYQSQETRGGTRGPMISAMQKTDRIVEFGNKNRINCRTQGVAESLLRNV